MVSFFFFKQKTAYEIGLGIPAEPLFRRLVSSINRPLLVMRSNLWASGYDVDGTDQTSLGQFSGRVQQTYKHSVPQIGRASCRESVWMEAAGGEWTNKSRIYVDSSEAC